MRIASASGRGNLITLPIMAALLGGCDPIVNIAGANFPAWMLCGIVGACLAAAMRPIFGALGLEPYLFPQPLVYLCLALIFGCVTWIAFFNRI
ncbi:MAG TPA: YtcA family lipoprotein [Candidatus Binataceae bacterium]